MNCKVSQEDDDFSVAPFKNQTQSSFNKNMRVTQSFKGSTNFQTTLSKIERGNSFGYTSHDFMKSDTSKFKAHLIEKQKVEQMGKIQNRVSQLNKTNEMAFKALKKTITTLE